MKTKYYNENQSLEYNLASDKVRRIARFYKHLLVYVIVNLGILFSHYQSNPDHFFSFSTFSTAFFWGLGLTFHAINTFGTSLIFGKNWEDRKIKELMEKNQSNPSQWS